MEQAEHFWEKGMTVDFLRQKETAAQVTSFLK